MERSRFVIFILHLANDSGLRKSSEYEVVLSVVKYILRCYITMNHHDFLTVEKLQRFQHLSHHDVIPGWNQNEILCEVSAHGSKSWS